MKLTSLLANRYLQAHSKNPNIVFMLRLCFAGIAIGTFALMLTLTIFNGFEKAISEKMQGITAPVVISAPGNKLDDASIKNHLAATMGHDIVGMVASSMRQVIIEKDKRQHVLILKGTEPENEERVSTIASKIVSPQGDGGLASLLDGNKILIGSKTAQRFNLAVGDELTVLIPEPIAKRRLALVKHTVQIGGIFTVGLEEYDNNFALSSLSLLRELHNETTGVDQLALKLNREGRARSWTEWFSEALNTFNPWATAWDEPIIQLIRA